jgi:hypothetical protein
MTERHPGEAGNDDEDRDDGLGDPAGSHGSDLDPRTDPDHGRPERPAGG